MEIITYPNFHQSVERDWVRAEELTKVVERQINEGWTIIAVTPRVIRRTSAAVEQVIEYIILRSKVL